jgi:uncharacterized protein (DUF1697 family)
MTAYVALLRGINVGGHHKVPMAELRAAFEALGLESVSTYIQSGNVAFCSDAAEDELTTVLVEVIRERFGFEVPVILREASELAEVAAAHSFADRTDDVKLLHVVFLAEEPTDEAIRGFDLKRFGPDDLVVRGRDAFVAYPDGSARSKFTIDVIERALGTSGTGRNWRTVQKLVELVDATE